VWSAALAAALAAAAAACSKDKGDKRAPTTLAPASPSAARAADSADGEAPCKLSPNPSRYPAARRVVAIGDVHGDMKATRAALRLAGAIDDEGHWSGGELVVVQTGDILDRGDDEQAILDWFETLRKEAAAAGGAFHVLNGNHELMNAAGDLRYVTPGGYADFRDVAGLDISGLDAIAENERHRVAAFKPGGPYARILGEKNTAIIVGDTVFVHGGLTPRYADYGLARLNAEIRCWLRGQTRAPAHLEDPNGPTWSRHYSMGEARCDLLARTLAKLGARRMVVAHTPQIPRGVNAACQGRVWRIDVGLAAHYGGPIEVLELRGTTARVLRGKRE
jgi:hypothetical protein